MNIDKKSALIGAVASALLLAVLFTVQTLWFAGTPDKKGRAPAPAAKAPVAADKSAAGKPGGSLAAQSVELSESEFEKFKVRPVTEHEFRIQREVIGNIDFNQEASVPVFPPFQGKVIALYASAGDDVPKGARLFTIDSPDLVQAESTLIAAAGTRVNTTRALERARQLLDVQGVSQKDLDQATSDQQAAEGAFKAARDAMRIFGKSDAEIDAIVAERKVDSVLTVHSPLAGRITSRSAAPGLFVQPGSIPAPYTVTDLSTMWMLANVPEADFPVLALGQQVEVSVKAYAGRVFRGRITNIGASVDPATRRLLVRSEVSDPAHELRAGMFATFLIRTGRSVRSLAVPAAGVVREGDGTMTVWVNTEGRRLAKRTVVVGLQQDGVQQILDGLGAGERIATEGAIFLSNALTAASR